MRGDNMCAGPNGAPFGDGFGGYKGKALPGSSNYKKGINLPNSPSVTTPTESTPPVQRSNPESGLSIRKSSGGKKRTPQRVKRSAAGARKRFKTT